MDIIETSPASFLCHGLGAVIEAKKLHIGEH